MTYTHLMLSGGGMYGLIYTGVYRYLKTHDYTRHIKHIYGTSFGAIMGFLIGMDLECEVFESLFMTPEKYFQTQNVRAFNITACLKITENKGIFSTLNIHDVLVFIIQDLYGLSDITFIEYLKKTGKDLHINSMCMNTGESVDFNAKTHPEMSVIKAIEASCAIPLIFQPVEHDGKLYVDGATANNLPIHWLPKDQTQQALAINILVSQNVETRLLKNNFLTYLLTLFMNMLKGTMLMELETVPKNVSIMTIPALDLEVPVLAGKLNENTFILDYSIEMMEKIIVQGYTLMHTFLGAGKIH